MRLRKKLSFLLVYLLIPLPFIGYLIGGLGSFLIFLVLFAGVPLFDIWLRDSSNPQPEQESQLLQDNYFKAITFIYVPLQVLMLLSSLYLVATSHLSWYELIGFTASVGLLSGGIGITLAHELMHKKSREEQFLSKLLLSMVCYGHFAIEHVRGHHLRVATPEDPASARLGESLYQFLPRTLIGSLRSAWHLEKNRLTQKNNPIWSKNNQFWWIVGAPILYSFAAFLVAGAVGLGFFLGQAVVAVFMLELVNYIEHYGLQRQKLANGRYEPVSPHHSWNANHWLSNMILFHLQRHSDHHTYGGRPYQILRHIDESPQLPSGYLGMMFVALFPPVWHRIMDKRALSHQKVIAVATKKSPEVTF